MAKLQFRACLEAIFSVSKLEESQAVSDFIEHSGSVIDRWHACFCKDLHGSKYGYPTGEVHAQPYLEDQIVVLVQKAGLKLDRIAVRPTLVLTHDIDNLNMTFRLALKRLISQRRMTWRLGSEFLSSIKSLLAVDRQFLASVKGPTVFVASRVRSATLVRRLSQWLVDPPYDQTHALFSDLVALLKDFECEVGVHGSFYSLIDNALTRERENLEASICAPVTVCRQHWLNLPIPEAMLRVQEAGIRIDTTFGWNGKVGFRGGMARPFHLILPNGAKVIELPLLLMDGPLFDDLHLSSAGAVELSKRLLNEVYKRRGTVALNWHDRAAHPSYSWSGAYGEILDWAKVQGFDFKNVTAACEHLG